MSSELLKLAHEAEEAMNWLRSAITTAGKMCDDDTGKTDAFGAPIIVDNGWKEMHEAAYRLGKIEELLKDALTPVQSAIDEEQKRIDDMPDEVDPHGFKYHPMA